MAAAQIHGWHQVKPADGAVSGYRERESSGQGILEHDRTGAAPEFLVRDGKFSITLGRTLLFLRPTGCLGRSARLLSE